MSGLRCPLVSRRDALVTLATGALGCRSGGSAPERGAPSARAGQEPWGGLEVSQLGNMAEGERGGVALVLLHGFGASADDLVPLAKSLSRRPGTRFVLPAAPLSLGGGSRAWWPIDTGDRPRYVNDEPGPAAVSTLPSLPLEVARSVALGVLRTTRERYAPSALFVGGFSQGAMLAVDLMLSGSEPIDRVAVLSGALLVESAAHFATVHAPRPPVFIAHGRQDPRLPFVGSERMRSELEQHGFAVTWRPFEGGHTILPSTIAELSSFWFGAH